MDKASKITLTTITEKTGFLGRRIYTEEALTMEYPAGKVIVRQSTVESAGDSWKLFKKRLVRSAQEQGIPCEGL